MDINRLITKIDRHLGLSSLSLEKYFPTIRDILMDDTLRTISQFFPYEHVIKMQVTPNDGRRVSNGDEYEYYITDAFLNANPNVDIISVASVTGAGQFETWNAPLASFNIDAMILEGMASNIRSLANISYKAFKFLPPNRIRLKGYGSSGTVYITCKCTYPSYAAVPESVSFAVEQLAKLDVKIFIWNELKLYDKLESADGMIDLKIDSWEGAEQERQSLIDEWRNRAFPNFAGKPYTYE